LARVFRTPREKIVKVPVRSRYRVNSGELAVAGARQGIGFAIVAAYPCQEDLAMGRLQEVPLDLCPRHCNCWGHTAIAIP